MKLNYTISKETGTPYDAAYFGKSVLRFREKVVKGINHGDPVLEMHVEVAEEDRGKGLAAEMIKTFLYREGGSAWFSYGRIVNPLMYKVFDKIKLDEKWVVDEYETGILIYEK